MQPRPVIIKRHTLLLCWLLLVIATVGMGLLARDAIRAQDTLVRDALLDQLRRQAETQSVDLGRFVDEVLSELMETLRQFEASSLDEALGRLATLEPFVTQTVLIRDGAPEVFSGASGSASRESLESALRRTLRAHPSWPMEMDEGTVSVERAGHYSVVPPKVLPQMRRREVADETVRGLAVRQQMNRQQAFEDTFSRSGSAAPELSAASASVVELGEAAKSKIYEPVADGWRLLPESSGVSLFGWIQLGPEPLVYAAVIDTEVLAARLKALLPDTGETFLSTRVVQPEGQVFVESVKPESLRDPPDFRYGLGSVLTGWTVEFFLDAGWMEASEGFQSLGRWVLLAMVGLILLGGTLLLWQAERARREALQKTNFVSTVSHELRTPLTSIQLYAEMLSEGRLSGEEKRAEYGQRIFAESSRLGRLVDNLLSHQKIEQSRVSSGTERLGEGFAIKPWIERKLPHYRLMVESRGLLFTEAIELSAEVQVRMDSDALDRCLTNLLDNAVKYGFEGGAVTLRMQARKGAQSLLIEILDQGPGVPETARETVFKPFYQCAEKLTERRDGLGIGLSLSRALIEEAGGRLTCQSGEAGKGACFQIELPLLEPAPSCETKPS